MLSLKKINWLKLFMIALAATIFRLLLQVIVPSSSGSTLPPSVIADAGLVPVAFFIYAFFGYTMLGIVFALVQGGLLGSRIVKGLLFGSLFCLMWVVYLFEPLPFANPSTLWELIAYPIADGLAMIILGLLLGRFFGTNNPTPKSLKFNRKTVALLVFPVLFVLVRIFGYEFLGITNSFASSPSATLVWATATGLSIGIMYIVLSLGIESKPLLSKAVLFGFVIFGIDLLVFNFFVALVFDVSLLDLFVRGLIDIISVTVSAFVYELAQ